MSTKREGCKKVEFSTHGLTPHPPPVNVENSFFLEFLPNFPKKSYAGMVTPSQKSVKSIICNIGWECGNMSAVSCPY